MEEISERDCASCVWEWSLWDRIIEDTGDRIWGEIATAMLELDEYIQTFVMEPAEISAMDWEYLRAVRHEQTRRQAWRTWLASQEKPKS